LRAQHIGIPAQRWITLAQENPRNRRQVHDAITARNQSTDRIPNPNIT
jgi:hypothetical protein